MPSPFNATIRLHLTETQSYAVLAALRTHQNAAFDQLHKTDTLRKNNADAADARSSLAKQYRNLATVAEKLGAVHTSTSFTNLAAELDAISASTAAPVNGYDYKNQAWIRNGRYYDCNHPERNCGCYGRKHAGEPAAADAEIH
jgi:hypothetical protein